MRYFGQACLFVVLFSALPAVACQCPALTEAHSLEVIEQAELIFAGRIVSLETKEQPEENFDYTSPVPVSQNPLYAKARIRILDLYKGQTQAEKVEAYIDTLTSCGHMLQIGDVTGFVLNRKDGVLLAAGQCDSPSDSHWQALEAGEFRTVTIP